MSGRRRRKLENPWHEPKKDTYISIAKPGKAPAKAEYVTISFKKGIPVKINGKKCDPIKLVEKLNKLGGKHGIGRVDMIEDRLVGIKSREIYEAPASEILHTAHNALEELTLDRETRRYKRDVSRLYSEMVYYGLWFTPLKEALDAFIDKTQEKVSGEVKIKLHKGVASIAGRKSPNSRYKKELATYGKGDIFDQSLAKGFIDLWAMPYKR